MDGPSSGFFFFFLALSGWEPESTPSPNLNIQIYIYTYVYVLIHLNIYKYISIYLWGREGGSGNAGAQNHDLSQKVTWAERLSWPRTWKETPLFCSVGRTWVGARASWFPCGLGSGQQLQARLMLGPGLGFSFGSGCSTFLGKAPPRQWTPLVFYITHRHERVWVFLTFSYGRDGIRHLIIPFISPSPFNVSRIRPSIFLTSKVSLPKLLP